MESSKLVSEPQACPPKKNKIDKHIKLIKEAIELIEKVVTLDSQWKFIPRICFEPNKVSSTVQLLVHVRY